MRTYFNKGVYKGKFIAQQRKILNQNEKYDIYWNGSLINGVIDFIGATYDYNTDMLIDYSSTYGVIVLANSRNDLVANVNDISRKIMYMLDGHGNSAVVSDDKFNLMYKIIDLLAFLILILVLIHLIKFVLFIKGTYYRKKLKVRNIFTLILFNYILPLTILVGAPLYVYKIYANKTTVSYYGWKELLYMQGIDLEFIFIISILLLNIGIIKTLCIIISRYRSENKF
jgi:hypothetical protein